MLTCEYEFHPPVLNSALCPLFAALNRAISSGIEQLKIKFEQAYSGTLSHVSRLKSP